MAGLGLRLHVDDEDDHPSLARPAAAAALPGAGLRLLVTSAIDQYSEMRKSTARDGDELARSLRVSGLSLAASGRPPTHGRGFSLTLPSADRPSHVGDLRRSGLALNLAASQLSQSQSGSGHDWRAKLLLSLSHDWARQSYEVTNNGTLKLERFAINQFGIRRIDGTAHVALVLVGFFFFCDVL